jgi:hypothetical protein
LIRVKCFLVFVLSICYCCIGAQQLQFKSIGPNEGLFHSNSQLPQMDKYGYLWIPSGDGIYSYDGARLSHYSQERYPDMSSDPIRYLYIDSKERLWSAFYYGNIAYKTQEDQFVQIENTDSRVTLGFGEIHHHGLFCITNHEILLFDETSHQFVLHQELTRLIEEDSLVLFNYIDGRHLMFVTTGKNVYLVSFDEKGNFKIHKISTTGITSTEIYDDNRIFVYSRNSNSLYLYDYVIQDWAELKAFKNYLNGVNHDVVALSNHNQNFYGITNNNELLIFDSIGNFKTIRNPDFFEENGLPVGRGYLVKCYPDGIMVIKHSKGFSFTNLNRQYINRKSTFTVKNKIFDNHLASITPDYNGNLYLSTFAGLIYWDRKNNDILSVGDNVLNRRFIVGNPLLYGSKVFLTDYSNQVSVYGRDGSLERSLVFDSIPIIRNLYFWKENYALMGTEDGVFIFDMDKLKLSPRKLLPNIDKIKGRIVDIFVSDDYMVVATSFANGLYRYRVSDGNLKNWLETDGLLSNRIYSVTMDHNKNIYAANRLGLNIINRDGRISTIDKKSGLKSDRVDNVIVDKDGNIWLTNLSSIFKYESSNGQLKSLEKYFLGSPNVFAIGSKASIGDSIIFFGGTDGLVYFHYKQELDDELSLTTSLKVNNELLDEKILLDSRTIYLPYDKAYLPIEMIINDLMINDKCFFRYRMQGYTTEWGTGNQNREVSFSLRPGSYQFEFEFSLDGRSWKKSDVILFIIVTPPFWLTTWFLVLIFSLIVLVGYIMYRYRVNKLLAIEQIRTKIASDLHDDVASTVGAISYYSEYGKSMQESSNLTTIGIFDKIGETAREAMESMRDVIWSTHSKFDNYEALKLKLMGYAQSLTQANNIKLIWTDELVPKSTTLNPLVRRNVYMILKEAINNAVKYSQANTIIVDVLPQGNGVLFKVSDNGIGFDIEKVRKGNGLENLVVRAAQMKAKLKIDSFQGKGTQIDLEVVKIS